MEPKRWMRKEEAARRVMEFLADPTRRRDAKGRVLFWRGPHIAEQCALTWCQYQAAVGWLRAYFNAEGAASGFAFQVGCEHPYDGYYGLVKAYDVIKPVSTTKIRATATRAGNLSQELTQLALRASELTRDQRRELTAEAMHLQQTHDLLMVFVDDVTV
jgi:hypothetical protein